MNEPKPVTLTAFDGGAMTDDEFKLIVSDPVQKNYSHITVERIQPTKEATLENLMASGKTPDLILQWNGNIGKYLELDLLRDITPYLKKQNIDISAFYEEAIKALRSSDGKPLYGLPYFLQTSALYYNKDIFDKLGVECPKDGMVWEDVMALAQKLTRLDNGVQYKGYDYDSMTRFNGR